MSPWGLNPEAESATAAPCVAAGTYSQAARVKAVVMKGTVGK